MRITFHGAAEVVTGSCYLCEINKTKIMVDCGLFQGGSELNELNFKEFNFNPAEIDYILLTHAHIDHSGRIPQLIKKGFKGKIITTTATKELCEIMLPDSGFIQEMEVEWINRKRQRAGKHTVEPIYTAEDALDSLRLFSGVRYNELINITSDITVRFRNAGHILGSAIIEMWVREKGEEFKIVFSGDLGNKNAPLLHDYTIIEDADYIIVESTYGNRLHKDVRNKALMLLDIITDTLERGGNVVIPSFAIERTQEILYELNMLKESKVSKIKHVPVYVDSPLAISATKIFENNIEYLNDDCKELIRNGDNPFEFEKLTFTKTVEESKAINESKESSIIISASGMCEAGRIKHHLKHNLWRQESSIVFVGYQAKGTLGRRLIEGEKNVKLFGEDISVNSKIYSIEGFSGHADQNALMEWLGGFKNKPSKVILVHGEDDALTVFSKLIQDKLGYDNTIAKLGETIELTAKTSNIVIKERHFGQKENVLRYLRNVSEKLIGTFKQLEAYVAKQEDAKLDTIYHSVDRINNALDDIKNQLK